MFLNGKKISLEGEAIDRTNRQNQLYVPPYLNAYTFSLYRYDFAVFGYFSDIIGEVFFPPSIDGKKQILESFVVFGLAFLVRPCTFLPLFVLQFLVARTKYNKT
jgi:hypothetical protein